MAKEIKTIGVLTSGGDAPGMNAAVGQNTDGFNFLSHKTSPSYFGHIAPHCQKLE